MYLDTIFTVYYAFYFIFSIVSQIFVFYLIVAHSPKSLTDLKKFMVANSLSQIVMCTSAFLTQVRIVPIQSSIALLSFGPCSVIGPQFCLTTYNFLNTSGCLVVASLLHMMAHRRRVMSTPRRISTATYLLRFALVYFLSIIVLVFSFIGPTNFGFIKALVITYYPTIELSEYTLSGFSDVTNFFCSTATGLIACHAYIPPIVALIWRRKIVREIHDQQSALSSRTQLQTRSFVRCLTWQTCLPLFFYLIPYTWYLTQQLFVKFSTIIFFNKPIIIGIGFVITEYLIFPMNTFSAVLDPICMLYFIKPYQKTAKSIIANFLGLTTNPNSTVVVTMSSRSSS